MCRKIFGFVFLFNLHSVIVAKLIEIYNLKFLPKKYSNCCHNEHEVDECKKFGKGICTG